MSEEQSTETQTQTNNTTVFTIPPELYTDPEYNNLRRSMLLLLADIIEDSTNALTLERKTDIIIRIEKSVYNKIISMKLYKTLWCCNFEYQYRLYLNRISKNMDITSEVNDSYLIDKIVNDEIDIDNIASLNAALLCPEKNNIIIEKINTRLSQKTIVKTSSMYTCRNCKKKEVSIKEVQLRRIDEATSISATCNFCGTSWII